MADSLKVKAILKEVHMLDIPLTSTTFESLKHEIRRSFPVLNQPNIGLKLYWIDEEGDKISLCSDADLKLALRHVNSGNLQLHIECYTTSQSGLSYQTSVTAALEAEYNVRNPPDAINRIAGQLANYTSTMSESYNSMPYQRSGSGSYNSMPSHQDGQPVQETVARQTSSQSEINDDDDVLDIPNTAHIFNGWPTHDSYSLSMISKDLKRQLDRNFLSERTYVTDAGRTARVLCIMNKDSREKTLYQSLDGECTYLQQFCKKVKWKLQLHKNKNSEEIEDILNNEMEQNFDTFHSLFVILLTRGDRIGIYGTTGRRIDYFNITKRFDQVEALKGKPKIFLIDDCEIGSDIHDELLNTHISGPETMPKYMRTISGNEVPVDTRDCESVSNECRDTFVCLGSTLGRSDKVVKGSWLIGALISVICKEGNKRTLQSLMKEVEYMLNTADIPDGKPRLELKITNTLTKDLYLLPPPC